MNIIGKKNTDKCEICGVKENVDHIIIQCVKYAAERERLQRRVRAAQREWSLAGILGAEGEGDKIRDVRKALFNFLRETRLMSRL